MTAWKAGCRISNSTMMGGSAQRKRTVFGRGYDGSVSAASFAADGHTVIGVDSFSDGDAPSMKTGSST